MHVAAPVRVLGRLQQVGTGAIRLARALPVDREPCGFGPIVAGPAIEMRRQLPVQFHPPCARQCAVDQLAQHAVTEAVAVLVEGEQRGSPLDRLQLSQHLEGRAVQRGSDGVTVETPAQATLKGTAGVTVESPAQATLKSANTTVKGDAMATIQGGLVKIN